MYQEFEIFKSHGLGVNSSEFKKFKFSKSQQEDFATNL